MALFEAFYERGCRLSIGWFEVRGVKPLGVDLVRKANEKVRGIKTKLLAAQSRQKEYADRKVRNMIFQVGDQVLLKVSPMKGVMRFGKKSKLCPNYIGPFMILDIVGPVAYKFAQLPHPVFYVFMLKMYHGNIDYIIKWDSILFDKDIQYKLEAVGILDCDIRKLRTKEIRLGKVQ
ncbi:uncharacterized protein LOC129899769 [Solanum dulcamara]|uniref:uncharacterized protein LOC129899769 n=1 Tax=Solanum dulcamara TaxID=45834 RepID=UPI0024861C92|nr:uncharacterized protein LOC129899769 [Solanum dulcamara]